MFQSDRSSRCLGSPFVGVPVRREFSWCILKTCVVLSGYSYTTLVQTTVLVTPAADAVRGSRGLVHANNKEGWKYHSWGVKHCLAKCLGFKRQACRVVNAHNTLTDLSDPDYSKRQELLRCIHQQETL
ncbi:hypothetical protein J6590_066079 [Homalodisca vitripennis]|nr:hypothetical protein J6590_066079 [Homalodisca vitripennis]